MQAAFAFLLWLCWIGNASSGVPPPVPSAPQGGGNVSVAREIIEQRKDALPPPKNGALVTPDGRGLRFVYHYAPPKNPNLRYAWQWAVETRLLSQIPELDALDGVFVMPRQLHYVAAECGAANAFYARDKAAIVLCYEMMDSLRVMAEALSKGAPNAKAFTAEFVRDNARFILLHETGHALIDLLDLAAVGREEDSVDQLATVMLLWRLGNESVHDKARVLQLASTWFRVNSNRTTSVSMARFADEHSLDAQRYYNILCVAYGQDPNEYRDLVTQGLLPKKRAARCSTESAKIARAWARLLQPHLSPRFQPQSPKR